MVHSWCRCPRLKHTPPHHHISIPPSLPPARTRWRPQPWSQSRFMVTSGSCRCAMLQQGLWRGSSGAAVGQGLRRAGAEVDLGLPGRALPNVPGEFGL